MTDTQTILRHTLATIAYRLTRTLIEVDLEFLRFQTSHGARTPAEIIFHMASVLSFCLAAIEKREVVRPTAIPEEQETERFFNLLQTTDIALTENEVELNTALKLIQGPLADILTHIGQLALLRRYYGKPIHAENFMQAKVQIGIIVRKNQQV